MTFVSSASVIANNTNSNLNSITQATNMLASINAALNVFSSTYLTYMTNYAIYIMEAIFGVILLASLMLLLGTYFHHLGMISSHVFDLFTCKKMVNGGWCLLGLFYFGVVSSMVFLLIIGGISHIFCDYFNGVINV